MVCKHCLHEFVRAAYKRAHECLLEPSLDAKYVVLKLLDEAKSQDIKLNHAANTWLQVGSLWSVTYTYTYAYTYAYAYAYACTCRCLVLAASPKLALWAGSRGSSRATVGGEPPA